MNSCILDEVASLENFDEEAYLNANPDVAAAVRNGSIGSGRVHFQHFGGLENRRLRRGRQAISQQKAQKLARIRPLLRDDMPHTETDEHFNYLSEELRKQFNIVDTDAVSSNNYDPHMLRLVEKYASGLVLDCGAGKRPIYYENVVNFEIVPYDTTDVVGVGEELPFKDDSFDAVISVAVLEHVKDPFRCAREISRVLKPGGELLCCVPFLQPFHGYPHHYYNMTYMGLKNLFADSLVIDDITVYSSVLPIWSLTWMLKSWAEGLTGDTREAFQRMTIGELLESPLSYLKSPFVTELSREKNLELASACVLFAHK